MAQHRHPKNVIGPTVRKLRYGIGLSQSELAAKAQRLGWDVSRDVIAKVENQSRWVGDFELILLARALGTTIEDLVSELMRAKGSKAKFSK